MRLSTFALWSTALVVSASMATGQEQKLPEFYEAHEIGFVDLNSPQELGGWLSTIPASSPMWSTVPRNDGRNSAPANPTVSNDPMAGRASAPVPAPGVPSTTGNEPTTPGAPQPMTTAPTVNQPQTRNRPGSDSGAPPATRPAPPRERRPVPATTTSTETTTTTTTNERPTNTTVDGGTTRFPQRLWGRLTGCDPLIHFYADSAVTVNVKAGFYKGVPVAWWPRGLASGEHVDFKEVRVDPRLDPVTSESIDTRRWPGLKPLSYLRDAMATPVKLGNKVEGGISYEGLMEFAPNLTVRQATTGVYEVRNDSDMDLINAILVPFGETHNGVALGTITPGTVVHVEMQDAKLQPLAALLAKQLDKSGLFPAEIAGLQKLILTPEFRLNSGARLLAQFSDQEWAKRFPLEIAPAPKRLVRVGMLRIFDAQLYNAAGDRDGNGRPAAKAKLTGHGRR